MSHSAVRGREVSDDANLRHFLCNILLVMFIGLIVSGAVAWFVSHDLNVMNSLFHLRPGFDEHGKAVMKPTMSMWWLSAAGVQLLMVFLISASGQMTSDLSEFFSFVLFMVFAVASGITLTPAIYAYTDASVAETFFVTAATFGAFAIIGKTTSVNLLGFGSYVSMALVGLLFAMVANILIFPGSSFATLMLDMVGIALFMGLTAYDMQRLETLADSGRTGGGPVVYGALTLYLDFVNLFIRLLMLFGKRK